ncbi:MAG TPA: TonB-dependent receptor plug domain-containing protein, partial [Opitutaceae bacterium]|nr:TonB-dependent receptor plug domain-containing protein [Opitutaceae bacterium]
MNPASSLNRRPGRFLAALAGAFLTAIPSWAQTATTPTVTTTKGNEAEVVKMSPFTVQASSRDVGYYAENTLGGTRLNTNISDLASSITVVTKQQLEDTASIDINDIFMYEANTEGSNTYTELDIDRGVARDPVSGAGTSTTRSTNNRVRGLGSADTAENNYPTIRSIPFDAYNTNTVEINRGPNSLLFGTGSPAGIVNQSTSTAVLNKRAWEVQYRAGSFGAYRGSLNTNQPLGDKAAVFAAALYDKQGFERKPSFNTTRREYLAFNFQPYASTQITADYEHYDNQACLPNYVAPLDYVTPWKQAGRPAFNPYTSMITILDTGKVMGPYVFDTHDPRYVKGMPTGTTALTNTTSPLYVPTI